MNLTSIALGAILGYFVYMYIISPLLDKKGANKNEEGKE